jgi:hypothetical protein
MGGMIVELNAPVHKSYRYHDFRDIDEAVRILKAIMLEHNYEIGELFLEVGIHECCVEDMLMIIGKMYEKTENYHLLLDMNDYKVNLVDGTTYELNRKILKKV